MKPPLACRARRSWMVLGALVLLSGALASAAAPQGDQRGGRKDDAGDRRRAEGVEFDWPGGVDPGKQASDAVVLSPAELVEQAMPAMISWPNEAGENAIRAMVVRGGPDLVPVLQNRLRNGTVLERSVSARALCLLKDRESIPEIEKLFFDRRHSTRLPALLFSLGDLDVEHTLALALRFVGSKSSILRRAAMQYYRSRDQVDFDRLRSVMTSTEFDAVRSDVYRLLSDLADPDLVSLALEHVGHPYAPLADAVAATLIPRCDDDVAAALIAKSVGVRGRSSLHSLMILAGAERRSRKVRVPEGLYDELLSEVRSSDPLLRATACIVCAAVAFRDESRREALERTILPALMDVVIRGRFFADFRLCHGQSVALLELITGKRLGSSIPEWRKYWEEEGGTNFGSLRELTSIRPDVDAASTTVLLEGLDARGVWREQLHMLGRNFRNQLRKPGGPDGILTQRGAMTSILDGLQLAGFFVSGLPRELGDEGEGAQRLTVELRGRVRTLVASASDAEMARWSRDLYAAAVPFLWQVFLSRDETFADRFEEESAWWTQETDEGARVRRLVSLGLLRLGAADVDVALATHVLELLRAIPSLQDHLSPNQLRQLSEYFATRGRDLAAEVAFAMVVENPSDAAFDALVAALEPRGLGGVPWIEEAIDRRGEAEARLDDPRDLVRLAAIASLAGAAALPEDALAELCSADPSPAVRARAMQVLADAGSSAGAEFLLEQAASGAGAARATALRALGNVADPRALEVLSAAAYSEELAIGQAAIEGLAARRDASGAGVLSTLVLSKGLEDTLGFIALASLRGMPAVVARPALERLAARDDPELARAARHGLADLGDMRVVPALLVELEDARMHSLAARKLTYLLCREFDDDPSKYRALWELDPTATHEAHLLAALTEAGYEIAPGSRVEDEALQPTLVAVLEDERWFLRRNVLEVLEHTTGLQLGRLSSSADEARRKDFAAQWRERLKLPQD